MTKNRAVVYARVSTERQREKHTIDSQLSILPEIINQRGYVQILEPYVDDGISGETIDERPAMSRLLEDAERGLFDAVFVVDLDRLTRARKSIDWEIIKDSLRKGRVKVVTPGTEYNFEDEDQEFMSDIFSRISAYEKKKILRRMTRGKKEKAKQGRYIGGKILYGYTFNETTKGYEIVEEEARAIRTIFDLCIRGYSTKIIPTHLNRAGTPTPHTSKGLSSANRGWAFSTVTKILNNTAYAGEFKRWKYRRDGRNILSLRTSDEWLTVNIPAIIDNETFERAREALRGRQVLCKRNSKRQYLLSGLIYCESCCCKMTGECSHGKNELLYYVCQNGRRKHKDTPCPIRSVRAEDIEQAVWGEIASLLNTPKLLKRAILESKVHDTAAEKIEGLEHLLHQKDEEEERLLDLYQYGKIDRKKLNERIEALAREREFIKKNIESVREASKVDSRLLSLNQLKVELGESIESFSFEKKRQILEILLFGKNGVGVFLDKNLSVELRGLIDFSILNNLGQLDKSDGIANTTCS